MKYEFDSKPVLFSGIQPSGTMHLGSYIGAIKNWVHLQKDYNCLFSIVDLHTITVRQDPMSLRERCYDLLALYVSFGIDPHKNLIFCQSHVPEHCQLAWILNCFVYVGELNRMTQFKDKSQKQSANINVGLFDYPALMAADILLYGTKLVPVGIDQKQHLELTRDVAIRFNSIYGEIFTIPEVYIPHLGAKIMSLQTPDKKMSKSDENINNIIGVLDEPSVIIKKIKSATTDSGSNVNFHESKPGISNLLTIYSSISGKTIARLETEYANANYSKFKQDLADALIAFLEPVQQSYKTLRADKKHMDSILKESAEIAQKRAKIMLDKVYDAIGFVPIL